ncbi:hypothetical protein SLEP1_g12060 [Rubroshorea leprosula]|nr:hypothetical protein SLEP1_g12060 [Rubroshorea leprosula]
MGTLLEVLENLPYPRCFKVHSIMCTELMTVVDKVVSIFPEIEAARPRCSSGLQALCSLNNAIERAKLLLQYCSESSKLFLAVTGKAIVSKCQRARELLEQSLGQIQHMVPVMLAVEISHVIDDLQGAVFLLDSSEEEAGKVVLELLKPGATESAPIGNAEVKAIKIAVLRLGIASPKDILVEKRSIKRLLDKIGDGDPKRKILKYLLYLLVSHGNLVLEEQRENSCNQQERSSVLKNHGDNSPYGQSIEAGAHVECGQYEAQPDIISRAIPPEEFKCLLSSRLMYDPVVIASGQTFERVWIQKWFDEGNDLCPKTKMKLAHQSFTPNALMRDIILQWCMKSGITISDPSVQPVGVNSLETSSTSISSFGSSINKLHIPANVSNMSLGSLDNSSTSDDSRPKITEGLCLKSEQRPDDFCRYQPSTNVTETVLESMSKLVELHWELQCNVVEDVNDRLKYNPQAFHSLSSENFLEPLIKFLGNASDLHDTRAQRAGTQLLLAFVSKNRNGIHHLDEDAFTLLSSFLESEVAEDALDVMEVLSENPICGSKIAASGSLASLVKILDSHVQKFREQALKILCNLSSISDVCSNLVSLNCISRLFPLLRDKTLSRYCIIMFKNLCKNKEARASIASTTGCIASLAEILEIGSCEDQENAMIVLLSFCSQSVQYCCQLAMAEGVILALCDISVNGTYKGRASALELLRILRNMNYDAEQECFGSDLVTSEDASNYSKKEESSHKTSGLFKIFTSKKKK